MKKRLLLAILVSMIIPGIVNAETITPTSPNGYHITWNVENIHYYVDQSAPGYSGLIAGAARNWVKTGYGRNKLYPFADKKWSAVDIYAVDEGDNGGLAYTSTFKRINGGDPIIVPWISINRLDSAVPTENWLFAEIRINNPVFAQFNFTEQQGTIAHEMGHAFGLGHNNENPNSIMCQTGYYRTAQTVQQADNDAFNRLYK